MATEDPRNVSITATAASAGVGEHGSQTSFTPDPFEVERMFSGLIIPSALDHFELDEELGPHKYPIYEGLSSSLEELRDRTADKTFAIKCAIVAALRRLLSLGDHETPNPYLKIRKAHAHIARAYKKFKLLVALLQPGQVLTGGWRTDTWKAACSVMRSFSRHQQVVRENTTDRDIIELVNEPVQKLRQLTRVLKPK